MPSESRFTLTVQMPLVPFHASVTGEPPVKLTLDELTLSRSTYCMNDCTRSM